MQSACAPYAIVPHVCPLLTVRRISHAPVLRLAAQEHWRLSGTGRHAQSCSSLRCSASGRDDLTASNLGEVAALDQLIDLLKNANGERELTKLVAENVLAFDSGFWLRLATRADAAQAQQEKQQLSKLANVGHPDFTIMSLHDCHHATPCAGIPCGGKMKYLCNQKHHFTAARLQVNDGVETSCN